ncbi:MAG: radical SAM protein [Bacillota bacterium]
MLIARRLAIIVTLKCTLNCKLCCNYVTKYYNPPIVDKEKIFFEIKEAFSIYDKIEWLQFVGGELFLHPDMDLILEEAFKYDAQFDRIILMTNGTIVPKNSVIEVLRNHKEKIEIHISDYGQLSYKINELEKILSDNKIPFVTKKFHGDIQYYGGWIDPGDFSDRGYSDEKIKEVFDSCWQIGMSNLHLYNGQIHNCIKSLFATDLEQFDTPKDEYIDLYNDEMTLEEKKEIARKFNTRPLSACKICSGFDSKNSKRYPAAEQM